MHSWNQRAQLPYSLNKQLRFYTCFCIPSRMQNLSRLYHWDKLKSRRNKCQNFHLYSSHPIRVHNSRSRITKTMISHEVVVGFQDSEFSWSVTTTECYCLTMMTIEFKTWPQNTFWSGSGQEYGLPYIHTQRCTGQLKFLINFIDSIYLQYPTNIGRLFGILGFSSMHWLMWLQTLNCALTP